MGKQKKPPAPALKVRVREEHVKTACRRDSHHCMIADALRDAVPEAKYIMVDLQSVRWSDLERGYRFVYFTPPLAQEALIRFDQGKAVAPFRFALRNGITRLVGWRANHPNSSRAGKSYRRTKRTRLVPTREREFGVRRLER